ELPVEPGARDGVQEDPHGRPDVEQGVPGRQLIQDAAEPGNLDRLVTIEWAVGVPAAKLGPPSPDRGTRPPLGPPRQRAARGKAAFELAPIQSDPGAAISLDGLAQPPLPGPCRRLPAGFEIELVIELGDRAGELTPVVMGSDPPAGFAADRTRIDPSRHD